MRTRFLRTQKTKHNGAALCSTRCPCRMTMTITNGLHQTGQHRPPLLGLLGHHLLLRLGLPGHLLPRLRFRHHFQLQSQFVAMVSLKQGKNVNHREVKLADHHMNVVLTSFAMTVANASFPKGRVYQGLGLFLTDTSVWEVPPIKLILAVMAVRIKDPITCVMSVKSVNTMLQSIQNVV